MATESVLDMAQTLGDRMKQYEDAYNHKVPANQFIVVRLDGRCFSKFTAQFHKPYDECFAQAMQHTALELCEEFHPVTAYTHSDEITLVWAPKQNERGEYNEPLFSGRVQKLSSVLAGFASARFNHILVQSLVGFEERHSQSMVDKVQRQMAHFDARVMVFPNKEEVLNALLWRQRDCQRNSVSSLARCHFSAKQLHGKQRDDQLAMLDSIGVQYHALVPEFRLGLLFKRRQTTVTGPDGPFVRHYWDKFTVQLLPHFADMVVSHSL